MRKVTGVFFVAAVLCFWVLASFVFAAPPGSQAPSSSNQVPLVFPDLRNVGVEIHVETGPNATTPSAGDQVRIYCAYNSCGYFQNKVFTNRIDIDGALFYEKEGSWVAGGNNLQSCSPNMCYSYLWVGANTWKATSGSHTIKCILDSNNNIVEGPQGEYNNTASVTIVVPFQVPDKIKDIKTKAPIPVPVPGPR
jgi:hypothetical protein